MWGASQVVSRKREAYFIKEIENAVYFKPYQQMNKTLRLLEIIKVRESLKQRFLKKSFKDIFFTFHQCCRDFKIFFLFAGSVFPKKKFQFI